MTYRALDSRLLRRLEMTTLRTLALTFLAACATDPTDPAMPEPAPAPSGVELVSGLASPLYELAVDADGLYGLSTPSLRIECPPGTENPWDCISGTNPDVTLIHVPLNGGAPRTLLTGIDAGFGLATDSTSVYLIDGGRIVAVPKDGGAAATLASSSSGATWVRADATHVYWIDRSYGSLGAMRVTKDGGSVERVAELDESANAFTTNDTHVYYQASGLWRVAKNGGAPEQVGRDADYIEVAADATHIYTAVRNGTIGTILYRSTTTGELTELTTTTKPTQFVAADGELLWLSSYQEVWIGGVGREPSPIAHYEPGISAIAVGKHDVYFATLDGGIRSVPR